MKKKLLVLRSLLIVFILSISLLGCGKENTEVADVPEVKPETESVQEKTVVQETKTEDVREEPETTVEETDQQEEETLGSASIWEDVKETDNICIVVLDENAGSETAMYADGIGGENAIPYVIKKEEKIYIPLKDNITDIFLHYCDGNSEATTLYSIDSVGVDYSIVDIDDNLKAIEVKESLGKDYNIMINILDTDEYIYFLIGYDNQ